MKRKFATKDLVLTALFAALTAVLAQIQLPIGPVPFNLAVFGAFLAGMLLSPVWAAASMGVYMLLGAVGIPVFAGFMGGPVRQVRGFSPMFVSAAERYTRLPFSVCTGKGSLSPLSAAEWIAFYRKYSVDTFSARSDFNEYICSASRPKICRGIFAVFSYDTRQIMGKKN